MQGQNPPPPLPAPDGGSAATAPPDAEVGQVPGSPVEPPAAQPGGRPKWTVLGGAVFVAAVSTVAGAFDGFIELGPIPRLIVAGVVVGGFVAWVVDYRKKNAAVTSRRARVAYYGAVALLVGCLGVVFFALRVKQEVETTVMPGTRDFAVVGFASGDGADQATLEDFSDSLVKRLETTFPDSQAHDYTGEERPPLEGLAGDDLDDANRWAADFVRRSRAEIVIGGVVRGSTSGRTSVETAVYVRPEQVPEAPELAGWYRAESIRTDLPLGSTRGREHVLDELVRRAGGLEAFTDALDAVAAGRPAEADDILRTLLPSAGSAPSADRSLGFLPAEFVRLFRGHALQQLARRGTSGEPPGPYEAAWTEYSSIAQSSPLYRRAQLSLAGNEYLRSVGQVCRPGTVGVADLRSAADKTRTLAADPEFTRIGRLKASVTYAQVQQCRIKAGLVPDDATVDEALARVRKETELDPNGTVAAEQGALASSIAAERAAAKGDHATAVSTMRSALDRTPSFSQHALWHALTVTWYLGDCDFVAAVTARDESLRELSSAVAHGEADSARRGAYQESFAVQFDRAEARCS